MIPTVYCKRVSVCLLQPVDSAENSGSVRALQQDLEELRSVNASLRKENHSLREQLNAARNGNQSTQRLQDIHMWNIPVSNTRDENVIDEFVLSDTHLSDYFRWGERTQSLRASKLWCWVCPGPQGFLPQYDLCQGSASAAAQTQAQCMYWVSEHVNITPTKSLVNMKPSAISNPDPVDLLRTIHKRAQRERLTTVTGDSLSHLPALVVLGHKMCKHTCSFCCYAYCLHCCACVSAVSRRSLTCWASDCLWMSRVVCSETSQSSWNSACSRWSKTSLPSSAGNENAPESGLDWATAVV